MIFVFIRYQEEYKIKTWDKNNVMVNYVEGTILITLNNKRKERNVGYYLYLARE